MELQEIIDSIYSQAQHLGVCGKFRGDEDLEEIIQLFKSPQGIEFCFNNHFPSLSTLRLFRGMGVERYGVYIDAGDITLINPDKVILIGRTNATIKCDTLQKHEVVLFHGAKAMLTASKWAVVFTKVEQGCLLIRNTNDNALVL